MLLRLCRSLNLAVASAFSRVLLFLMRPRPLTSTLFPYTTLFRSKFGLVLFLGGMPIQEDAALAGIEPFQYRVHAIIRPRWPDRKSTRLNSSHVRISYAVFCLKKKNSSLCALIHSQIMPFLHLPLP